MDTTEPDFDDVQLTFRKNPTVFPSAVSALMRAVTDHAEAPKPSAEIALVPRGNANGHF